MYSSQLKILLLDTEWSYALAYIFPSKKPQYISSRNIKIHQFCVCAAWKWLNESSRYSVKITDDQTRFKRNKRDDYIIAKKMHELMTQADVVIAHNGDDFDIKFANTLFITHGLGPIPEKKSLDTLKAARKYFRFAGNDLDSLSKRFGGAGKVDKPDWIRLTESDSDEIEKAANYCMDDVMELERVFINIRPYMRNLVKRRGTDGLYGIAECDACKSLRLHFKGLGGVGKSVYPRVRCAECGHEHKGDIKIWRNQNKIDP